LQEIGDPPEESPDFFESNPTRLVNLHGAPSFQKLNSGRMNNQSLIYSNLQKEFDENPIVQNSFYGNLNHPQLGFQALDKPNLGRDNSVFRAMDLDEGSPYQSGRESFKRKRNEVINQPVLSSRVTDFLNGPNPQMVRTSLHIPFEFD
jgi:hypothetical protein